MSILERVSHDEFDRTVSAVDLDERFLLIGKLDGSIHVLYLKNGLQVFCSKISECPITAVCCEKYDEKLVEAI